MRSQVRKYSISVKLYLPISSFTRSRPRTRTVVAVEVPVRVTGPGSGLRAHASVAEPTSVMSNCDLHCAVPSGSIDTTSWSPGQTPRTYFTVSRPR